MTRLLLGLLAVAALGGGCRKPLPSPDYIEASNRYTSLIAVQGEQAYSSPAMDEVTAQLQRVPNKSSDYPAAVALIATIAAERARVTGHPTEGVATTSGSAVTFPSFAAVEQRKVEETPDAAANELARGADFGALERKYVGCLLSGGEVTLLGTDGGTSQAEGFQIHDSPSCKSRLPGVGANLVLVQAGKILHLVPMSAVRTATTSLSNVEDGGKPLEP